MRSASGVTTMMQRPVGHRVVVGAGPELHADGEHVVAEHLAELVVVDLADVGGAAAEAGDTAHRVGRRAAAHLDRRAERLVEVDRAIGVDQVHPALDQPVLDQERVGGVGDHVDQCVADPDDVEPGVALRASPRDRPSRPGTLPVRSCDARAIGTALPNGGGPLRPAIGTLADVTLTDSALSDRLDPYRLPRHTAPDALRPRARARSRGGDVRRPGRDRRSPPARRPMRSCSTRSSSRSSAVAVDGEPAPWQLERDHRAPVRDARRRRGGRRAPPDDRVHRHPQRPSSRLVPQHVPRRRAACRARDRHHPDAVHRLPAGVPVLGRTRLQGGVRHHARRRP